jgi:RNA polymerase primary sigma factor
MEKNVPISFYSEVVDEMVPKGKNTFENTQYSISPLGDNHTAGIQQKEGPDSGRVNYGQKVRGFEHGSFENVLSAYIREVAKIPLLSDEQERALAKQIQEGQSELVRRLLKLDLKMDHLDMITKKDRNVSDDSLAAILAKLDKLEREDRISPHQIPLVSEIRTLYGRLTQLKGEMLKRNLRLVIKIAKGYRYPGISFSDLIQEGNLGLMKAVTKFDYKRGYRFGTYATFWIRQSIQRGIAETCHTIRIPVGLMEKRKRLTKARSSLLKKQGKVPQPEEIAEKARVSLKAVHKALFSFPETISLETPVGEDSSLGYFIEDEKSPSPFEVVERKEVGRMAEKVLSDLPPREAEILRLRFGIGGDQEHTLEEIGRKFGICRERVRQLEKRGISRLRHSRKELSAQVERIL